MSLSQIIKSYQMEISPELRYKLSERNEYFDNYERLASPYDKVMRQERIILRLKKDPYVAAFPSIDSGPIYLANKDIGVNRQDASDSE